MVTVALIGPDGAGKTTICRQLEQTLPLPVKYLYMGVNRDASNSMLPTTRLIRAVKRRLGAPPDTAGPPDPARIKRRPKGMLKGLLYDLKGALRLANQLGEEWYRQGLAWYYQRRGYVVLFDRHFYADYYAYDIANGHHERPFTRRVHGFLLQHAYPRPDLVVYLDAPAEVLFARKGEGTIAALERRRQEYLQLRDLVREFVVVDASRPLDQVVSTVADLIEARYRNHGGGMPSTGTLQASSATVTGTAGRSHARLQDSSPVVLVTDAGRGSAIAFIRSLGRKGWRVIAADSEPGSPGLRSRFAAEQLVYPDPREAPERFVETILQAVRSRGIDLIVPVTDEAILPLAGAREEFAGLCRLALPEPDALAVVTDKLKTLELAERVGVPAPRTRVVSTVDEALAAADELGWPVVLKPQASRIYREEAGVEAFKVTYAEDQNDLAARMRRFEGRCQVLLQEYYPGTGYGVELLMHRGRPLAAFQHRRLREVPVQGGASAFRESVALDPALYRDSVRLLEALCWTGLAMVEFKVGASGPRLMEINGRVWGSLPLAVLSGMDFPAKMAELYLFGPPPEEVEPDCNYRLQVRARNLRLECLWIASVLLGRQRYPFLPMPSRREGVVALLELLNPAYRFDILSLEDPRPGLAELGDLVGAFRGKLREAA